MSSIATDIIKDISNWKEITNGIFICQLNEDTSNNAVWYEIVVDYCISTHRDLRTAQLHDDKSVKTAMACLYKVYSTYVKDNGMFVYKRTKLLHEQPVFECTEVAANDAKEF